MAATRTVYRGARGRFAGASVGKPEKVTSGGFHNAAFQARFQAMRAGKTNARPSGVQSSRRVATTRRKQNKTLLAVKVIAPAALLGAGAGGLLGGGAGRLMGGPKMSVNSKLLATAAMAAGAAGVNHNVKVGARARSNNGRRIKR